MIFSVNNTIVLYNSGIEHAEIKRAKLFNQFHQSHKILLDDWNQSSHWITNKIGLSDNDFINMYDYYQHSSHVTSRKTNLNDLSISPNSTFNHFANCTIIRHNEFSCWIYFFNLNGHYSKKINKAIFYKNDRCYCINYYDIRGFLSRKTFTDGHRKYDHFYSPNSKVMMTKSIKNNGHNHPYNIYHIRDYNKPIIGRKNLILHFLNLLCLKHQSDRHPVIFISDRWWRNDTTKWIIKNIKHPHYTALYMHFAQNNDLKQLHNPHTQDIVAQFVQEAKKIPPNKSYDAVICSTEKQCQSLKKNYHLNRPLFSIPVGVNDNLHPKRIRIKQRNHYQISCATRISPVEGIPDTIKAFGIAKQKIPQLKLDIYGRMGSFNSPFKKQLKRLNKRYSLINSLTIHDYTLNVPNIYRHSQLTLTTAPDDAFNISLLEALSQGCPAVTFTNSYGPCDMIKNGYDGYKVIPNPVMMAKAIVAYFKHPLIMQYMSDNAYHMAQRYSPKQVWKKWKKFINQVQIR